MAMFTRSDALRVIAAHYPDHEFRIKTTPTVGMRPVFDFRPTLAWRSLARGSDSAVEIGLVEKFSGKIDWKAQIETQIARMPLPEPPEPTAPAPRPSTPRPQLMKPREIAARLREAAVSAPAEPTDSKREFRFGTLVIRCLDDAESIRKVAAKYERGFRLPSSSNKARPPSLRCPPNADELLRLLEIELADPVAPKRPVSVQTSAMSAAA